MGLAWRQSILNLGILLLLTVIKEARGQCAGCESPNVRTILFRQTDLLKECWSDEELALLYTRRVVQELIPKKATCRIPLLLEYLKIVLEAARDVATTEKTHRIIIMAIADAFGGYLQAYGIPITNAKYYEGTVSYCTARQVNELQTAFKRTLDTDGGGWTRPIYIKKSHNIQPYAPPVLPASVCSNLVTSAEPKDHCSKCNGREPPEPVIPLPFLDDLASPRAIAVPFRDKSLYSLFNRNASDILLRYYSTVLRCIGPPTAASCTDPSYNSKIDSFIVSYHAWLVQAVLPHLHDDVWYPGFGGVLMLTEEMSKRGLLTPEVYDDSPSEDFSLKLDDTCDSNQTSVWFYALGVLGLFILFWIIVCICCCLCKICGNSNENDYHCSPSTSSSGAFVNTLVSMYCDKQNVNGKGNKPSGESIRRQRKH